MAWEDDFKAHTLHNNLDKLLDSLNNDFWQNTPQAISVKMRVQKLIELIKSLLKNVDTDFVSKHTMDNVLAQINNLQNFVNIDKQRNDINTTQTNNFFNHPNYYFNLLTFISPLLGLIRRTKFSPSIKSTEKEVIRITNSINKSNERLDIINGNYNNLDKKLSNTDKQISDLTSKWQSAFLEAQNSRNNHFTEKMDELKNTWDEVQTKFFQTEKDNFFETSQGIITDISEKRDHIHSIHKEIEELFEMVGNNSVSGGYSQTFENEAKKSNIFRQLGVGAMLFALIWAIVIFFCYDFSKYSVGMLFIFKVISSVFITVLLVTIGGYFLSLSSKHSNIAIWAKQTELEVKAIDPFISSLSEEVKIELKRSLTEKIFGQVKNPFNPDKEEKLLIQKNIEELTSLIKGLKIDKDK